MENKPINNEKGTENNCKNPPGQRGCEGLNQLLEYLQEVSDPEIPVLSIVDLGIVRNIETSGGETVISITPTYTGCPAMRTIEDDIAAKMREKGLENFRIKTVLAPAWTTDWISENGRKKMLEYGIAPPEKGGTGNQFRSRFPKKIICPHCGSDDTGMKSFFGSTPCKALYICKQCKEPFDYFKCI